MDRSLRLFILASITFTMAAPIASACSAQPVLEVDACEICVKYWDNEIKADLEYKDKTIVVGGEVANVGRDNLGGAHIILKFDWRSVWWQTDSTSDNNGFGEESQGCFPPFPSTPADIYLPPDQYRESYGVQCKFNDKYISDISELEDGDYVFAKGKCIGCSRDLQNKPNWIVLENCRIKDVVEKSDSPQMPFVVPSEGFSHYENMKYNFQLYYPPDWEWTLDESEIVGLFIISNGYEMLIVAAKRDDLRTLDSMTVAKIMVQGLDAKENLTILSSQSLSNSEWDWLITRREFYSDSGFTNNVYHYLKSASDYRYELTINFVSEPISDEMQFIFQSFSLIDDST